MTYTVRLPAAVRCFTVPLSRRRRRALRRRRGWRSLPIGARVLILDTETRADLTQALIFGRFHVYEHKGNGYTLVHDGLILGEAMTEADAAVIRRYSADFGLPVYPREVFVREVFLPEVHELGALCVGYNLNFDLSRLAARWAACRKRGWRGGFTLPLLSTKREPPVHVRALDSKRSFIELGSAFVWAHRRDRAARQPPFRGRFLDLRTLAYALTGEGHTLESACGAFGISYKKRDVEHGLVAPENLAYNGEDLDATWQLSLAATAEWNRHPFVPVPAPRVPAGSPPQALPELDPGAFVVTAAFSPATMGKAYLRAMGVRPPLEQHARFPRELLGFSMAAYFGGRSECRIRRQVVPVTYCDVLSMYPSVCVLMRLWRFVIADHIEVEEATEDARALLERVTLKDLYRREMWRKFPILAEVEPDGDVLPLRAQYQEDGDYQIGLNVVTADPGITLFYMLPDLVASKLLAGKAPRIRRAWRLRSVGVQEGLRPVKLFGEVRIDPVRHDFFRLLVEKRHEFKRAKEAAEKAGDTVRARYFHAMQLGLKILVDATAYGIFAEIDEKTTGAKAVDVYGTHHFNTRITKEEHPGRYMFPPLAALITSAARLMLAMAERELAARGATFAFCDTDSVAIVGPADVARAVRRRFARLTPYAFGGDLLEVEDENVPHPRATRDPQLYCYAISAKRYAMFNNGDDGGVIIRKPSEHGLGHLRSPLPDEGRGWIEEAWRVIVQRARNPRHVVNPPFADLPAVGKFPITKPSILRQFDHINTKRVPGAPKRVPLPYPMQVKPFSFMLVAYPDTGDITTGGEAYWPDAAGDRATRGRRLIRPVAPFESDPRVWPKLKWVDLHTGRPVRLIWRHDASGEATSAIRVQTFRDVLSRHVIHPEAKAAGPDGEPCGPHTTGELGRLHVHVTAVVHIGKESNDLEEVQAGLVPAGTTYVHYVDAGGEWEWDKQILKTVPRKLLAKWSGLHVRSIKAILNTSRLPHPRHRRILHKVAEKLRRRDPALLEEMRT